MIHQTLATALERATHALEEGDAVTATDALQQATLACEAAFQQGLLLERGEVELLRGPHARCASVARREKERFAVALGTAGDARRALSAYHR